MNSSSTEKSPVLTLQQVSYRAGRNLIINSMSLKVAPGEFIGIIGPNGAGKSTLLNLAGALLKPEQHRKAPSGSIQLFGRDVWTCTEKERCALRSKAGMVFQHVDFNPALPITAKDVLVMGLTGLRGLWQQLKAEDISEIEKISIRFEIEHLLLRPYRNLSGGEKQKVHLARALLQKPSLLLLDEPATGLDPQWQEKLVALVGDLYQESQITILMTTHLTGLLPDCCRRVLLMQKGQLLFDGPIDQGFSSERLSGLYDCRMEVFHRSGRWYCHSTGDSEK